MWKTIFVILVIFVAGIATGVALESKMQITKKFQKGMNRVKRL